MPSLTEIRDASIALLKTVFQQIRVEAFSGALDLDAAGQKRFPSGTTVLVAVLEALNNADPESLDFDMLAEFGVLVVTKKIGEREKREQEALAFAETIASTLHGADFGLAGVGRARVQVLSPVTNDELENYNLCVWSLTWTQALVFHTERINESV